VGVSSRISGHLRVRHVLAEEHTLLRELRLASLASDPQAFGSTHAREDAQTEEWWRQWAEQSQDGTAQRTFVLVGDEDDRWLGLALVRVAGERSATAILSAMWVSPEVRGRGGSRMLCDACAAWAIECGVSELALTVVVDNERARRAYEAAGFVAGDRTTWSGHGRTLEEFVMSRSL
jgi:RimJ/RimL family protein N-acetyltransferase